MRTIVFRSPTALYAGAADAVVRRSVAASDERGTCVIAVSGGKTPLPLYRLLSTRPWLEQVPWTKMHVLWADERCVPPDHEESNYLAIVQALLRHVPIPAANVHRIRGEDPPADACRDYEQRLRSLAKLRGDPMHLSIDLAILGLGRDGHTASLFPNHPALLEDQRWVRGVTVPTEPRQRITLTLPLLNQASHILFLVTGREKRDALLRIQCGEDLPAARIAPVHGEATWFLDAKATSG